MAREVFDRIASGWYNYRHRTIFRSELEEMAERWQSGSLLNAGCGHGPDFLPFRDRFRLYGIDFSGGMLGQAIKYAAKYGFSPYLVQGDIRSLPFDEGVFDYAIAVATYHHIEEADERVRALKELHRVLKPGGEAFITLWNRWQRRFWFTGNEPAVPWRMKEETLYRYYYLFSYRRAEKLVKEAGFKLLRSFPESSWQYPVKYFSRNICLLVEKP